MRMVVGVVSACMLAACATDGGTEPGPDLPVADDPVPFTIEGLTIHNGTGGVVRSVTVLVPATGRFVSCGNILPRSQCSTTFPATVHQGHAVRVEWQQGGETWTVGPFVVAAPEGATEQSTVQAQVILSGPGAAGARFVPR